MVVGGLVNPQGVALDVAAGQVYWTDVARIQRADFAGNNLQDLVTGLVQPFGVALDLTGQNIFWTDPQGGKIQWAPFAGGVASDVLSSLANPTAITILTVPILVDANGDGFVDFTDLGILLNNYNKIAPVLATAAPVPEPSTLALAALGALGLLIAARRKR